MIEHLPECRTVTSWHRGSGGGYYGILTQHCAPDCPVRARAFSPAANIAAAARYMRERYSKPWEGFRRG